MSKDLNNRIKTRIIIVKIVIILAIFLLGAKSFELQVLKAEDLNRKAENDYSKYITIKGERGQILDRNMNKLATSIDAITITASPAEIKNPEITAKKLSEILNINKSKLQQKLSTKQKFTWVQKRVTPDQAEQIKKLKLHGIYFKNDSKRFYPNKNLAAQIIGFTGDNDKGLEGLEFKYNSFLEGKDLKLKIKKDGNGRVMNFEKRQRANLNGSSLVLTIDKKIQFLSEKILEKTVKTHMAKSGIALVMRPKTGEVLSIAHYPEFNPNNFKRYDNKLYRNRAVTDAFEPGSTMKVFTAAAALEKGFDPDSIFFCENGTYKIGKFTISDTHSHSWLSIDQIIKFSSNIGTVKIAQTIGNSTLHKYLENFGFGSKTKIAISGETTGRLIPHNRWSKIDTGSISFGQGVSVSAIQLLSGISAIANDGKLMKPMLIKKIVSNNGETLHTYHPETIRQAISEKTASQVKNMMSLVVENDGTGTKAAIKGFSICGKTGTAQKALKNKRGYAKNRYTSIFAGFAPKNNPELATLVVIDEPTKKYYGGDVAAPAFKSIMAESFTYFNIAPETIKTADESPKRSLVASLSVGEKK